VDYPSEQMQATFAEVVRSQEPWTAFARPFEFPDHPDWGLTYWDLSAVPILDPNGRTEMLLFSLQDVTERARAEQQVQAYQERLRELTSELALTEERERRNLATSIHDDLIQNLAFAKMRLAQARTETEPGRPAEALVQVAEMLDAAIRYTRDLTFEISPPILYQLGFEPAVEWLSEHMEQRHGYTVRVETDGQPKPLSQDTAVTLFQAVRELLTNVAKHAEAGNVVVTMRRLDGHMEVEVVDDGVGFDATAVVAGVEGGFGLFNIGERLRHLGGRFEVESRPGAGARFVLTGPLHED